MKLNPEPTKASSSLNEVGSSAVHPKTLPPKASGAISNPELPSFRFCISAPLSVKFVNHHSSPPFGVTLFWMRETAVSLQIQVFSRYKSAAATPGGKDSLVGGPSLLASLASLSGVKRSRG